MSAMLLHSIAKLFRRSWIFFLVIIVVQCTSSNLTSTNDNNYTLSIGKAEQPAVDEVINYIINRYHFELERNTTYGSGEKFIRTFWRSFPPFTSDPTFEPEQVQVRLILTSTNTTSQGYILYKVHFEGQYRALLPSEEDETSFQAAPLTEEARDYFKDIAHDLKDRLRGSFRGY